MSNGNYSITGAQGQAYFGQVPFSLNVLLSAGYTVVSRPCIVATAVGIQQRGAIGHYDDASQNFTVPAAGGEATCNAILAQYTDPTAGNVTTIVYVSGKFRVDAVTFPTGASKALCDVALRNYGLFLESVEGTTGQMIDPHALPLSAMSAEQLEAEAKRLDAEAKRLDAEAKQLAEEAKRREEQSKRTGTEAEKTAAEAKKAEAAQAEAKKKAEAAKEPQHNATTKTHEPVHGHKETK